MDLYFCSRGSPPILGEEQMNTEGKVDPWSNTLQVLYIHCTSHFVKREKKNLPWRERSTTHYKILKLMYQEYLDNIRKQVTDYQSD